MSDEEGGVIPFGPILRSVGVWWVLTATLAVPAAAGPALWVVTDADSEIYLFGTVHILPPELDWQSDEVRRAFERSDTVWFEAPVLEPAGQAEMLELTLRFGVNPPGRTLSSQISPEAREALERISSQVGLPDGALEAFRPWMAAVTLTAAFVQSQGYDPESGVESVLGPMAARGGKRLAYLETVEEQIRMLADLPEAAQVSYLEETVFDFEEGADVLDRLVEAWEAADLGTLDELMNAELRQAAPELDRALLVERNRKWVERIMEILDGSGTHFIAVGAGHFLGPDGVVALLRASGAQVAGP